MVENPVFSPEVRIFSTFYGRSSSIYSKFNYNSIHATPMKMIMLISAEKYGAKQSYINTSNHTGHCHRARVDYTGELGYDGLNGTRKIGPSYAKSVVYI